MIADGVRINPVRREEFLGSDRRPRAAPSHLFIQFEPSFDPLQRQDASNTQPPC